MLDAIDNAKHRVDFVTFVYWSGRIADRFAEALANAASRGIRVRVLLDACGCKSMEDHNIDRLTFSGVDLRWFRPLSKFRLWRLDKRTHRKILVVDDAVAFTGGVGIADERTGDAQDSREWRDTHLRIEAPAALGLRAALVDNWNASGDWTWDAPLDTEFEHSHDVLAQVFRAASTIGWTDMAAVIRSLTALSKTRLRLRAGAAIWQYDKTMQHAKIAVVDDLACCIGSPNLNRRSMGEDVECCFVTLSSDQCH